MSFSKLNKPGYFRVETKKPYEEFPQQKKRFTLPALHLNLKERLPLTRASFALFKSTIGQMISFTLLLVLYLSAKELSRLSSHRFFPPVIREKFRSPLTTFYARAAKLLDTHKEGSISRIDLIELSVRNMKAKKTRTIVTIGGMAIGIGAIVFLVSIGYGLQQLVVTRVARLEEMRQADVSPQAGGKVKINDKSLSDFKEIQNVKMVLPLIAVVGRVNYQNSVSDMAVYGVTSEYLKQSAIKPINGKIFDSNELQAKLPPAKAQVAGVSTERKVGNFGQEIQDVDYAINPSMWVRVREKPSTSAKILGYTKRVEGSPAGVEVWGDSYEDSIAGKGGFDENDKPLGRWIKAPVLLWKQEACDTETQGDCEGGKYLVSRDEDGKQAQTSGYFAEINLSIAGVNIKSAQVLGITNEAGNEESSSESAAIDWIEIASEAGVIKPPETKTVVIAKDAKREAVVNRAMLKVLGISENQALGKKFSASFVVVGDLLADNQEKLESAQAEYTIVGVTPEDKTPVFYVPFMDLRSLGIANFSQVKLVMNNQSDLNKARKQVEAMGYITRSVADTVAQINSLFATAKTILALLGMVALTVAALGMFNTLTVSLLERTREVGLMKAMGMKSSEVQELFLTESMIMGFLGGILGIIGGWFAGKAVGVVLSFFAIFRGVGFVDISYLPFSFVLIVVLLSLLVGIATGIYPARRATKISALDALRYE